MRLKASSWPEGRSRDVYLEVAACWDRLADLEGSKPWSRPPAKEEAKMG
jgi:hypothetical protein